jgi:hypothetical protein
MVALRKVDVEPELDYVDEERGRQIIDEAARLYLGMSGADFVDQYRRGLIPHPDRSEVVSVAMLLPFVGESSIGGKRPD